MVIYQYVCHCDCRYVGRTSQRLHDRINQHIPRCIRSNKRPTKNLPNRECKITSTSSVYCDSAIGQHLLENKECAKHFNDAQFSILATARSSFHLSVLEATYAKVIPVHKKENATVAENYRPISLLPYLSKLLEKIVYNRLFSFLTHTKQLSSTQFGFRQGHSTSHAVSLLIEKITNSFEEKKQIMEYLLIYVKHLKLLIIASCFKNYNILGYEE